MIAWREICMYSTKLLSLYVVFFLRMYVSEKVLSYIESKSKICANVFIVKQRYSKWLRRQEKYSEFIKIAVYRSYMTFHVNLPVNSSSKSTPRPYQTPPSTPKTATLSPSSTQHDEPEIPLASAVVVIDNQQPDL